MQKKYDYVTISGRKEKKQNWQKESAALYAFLKFTQS